MTSKQRGCALIFIFATFGFVLTSCAFNVWNARQTTTVTDHVTMTKIDIDEDVTLVTIEQVPDTIVVFDKRPTSDPIRVTHVHNTPVFNQPHGLTAGKWTLPFTCDDAKYYHLKFSKDQLEAMRVAAHIPRATAGEMRQINECLASR